MMDRTKQNGRHLPHPSPKILKDRIAEQQKIPQNVVPSFRISSAFLSFHLLGFWDILSIILSFRILVIFHHSAFYDFDSLCHLIMGDRHSFIHSFIQICQHGKFAFYSSQGKGSLCFHCLEITGKRCKKIKRKKNQVMVN